MCGVYIDIKHVKVNIQFTNKTKLYILSRSNSIIPVSASTPATIFVPSSGDNLWPSSPQLQVKSKLKSKSLHIVQENCSWKFRFFYQL